MTTLIAGIALWWAAHLFKRLAPATRAKLGEPGKGIFAVLIVISVVLMVLGYRAADGPVYWGRDPMWVGINNLLMLLAFYFYAASGAKGAKIWLGTKVRHPQLTGFSIWAVAHLLVNGDLPSFVLFGGLLSWAIVEVLLINTQDGPWERPPRAPFKKEVVAIVITLVIYAIVMGIHYALGVTPWG
ncbi:NnrU family protein [Cognatiyoonia sp. IB215182]|uniref:NnrU family protein n=1 Tax=Cognatiyoonia sp. IB215182 TaxID=3097353 RepID=UPI002A14CF1E|nr:NnrU family protein [Cognatiyoonia sp. IB215182]MDX8351767.1 NnrU family protein [Cognatiyoonia sp. IB215182]